jgi:hypothetical protein
MQRTIDLDQIRVVQADNYKGNSRVYLEIMDQRILYSSPGELPEHWVSEDEFGDPVVDTGAVADFFRAQLGHIFARLLLESNPGLNDSEDCGVWSTAPADGREIGHVKPRLAEDPYED